MIGDRKAEIGAKVCLRERAERDYENHWKMRAAHGIKILSKVVDGP